MSGTRDFLRIVAKLHPTSEPVSLSDYHARNPNLEGPFDPPSLANKFVQFVHASAEAARLHPPAPDPHRRTNAIARTEARRTGIDATGSIDRRLPPSAYSSASASSNSAAFKVIKGNRSEARKNKPEWKDVPYSSDLTYESEFLNLPSTVLDLVLSDATLNLRDHLALAATCRPLRACYYSPPSFVSANGAPTYSSLWRALVALRPPIEQGTLSVKKLRDPEIELLVHKLWTNGLKVDVDSVQFIRQTDGDDTDDEENDGQGGAVVRARSKGRKRARTDPGSDDLAIRSKEWNNAIDLVHTIRISKTEAKKRYKVSEKELNAYLASFVVKSKTGSNRILYLESAVEALALRLHGGPSGHKDHLAKLAEKARKARITRDLREGGARGGGGRSDAGSDDSD